MPAVDRPTIVAHDRFREIIEFNRVPTDNWSKLAEVRQLKVRVAERVKPMQSTLFAEEKEKLE